MITFKEFTFEAAHQIPPFSGLHGHSFQAELQFSGNADPVYGWAISLSDVERTVDRIRLQLDHKYLNEVEGLEVPSLENVASWIWRRVASELPGLERVL